jgi:hypothetical protein
MYHYKPDRDAQQGVSVCVTSAVFILHKTMPRKAVAMFTARRAKYRF